MLTLAVLGRYVQWCSAVALLPKDFERVGEEPLMTAPLGLQLLTIPLASTRQPRWADCSKPLACVV